MVALLDVNVLLAFAWPNHRHHTASRAWADAHLAAWASCALTQLAFVRLSANPAFTASTVSVAGALDALRALLELPGHTFFADDLEPERTLSMRRIDGHKQINDAYLLALAERHDAELVTFDRRITALADPRDRRRVRVLSP